MTSRSLFRPARAIAALTATATLALGVVACSDDDSDSASTTGAAASDSSSSSDDKGTWPREVDSVVVNNGQAGKETEKVEIPAKPEKIVSTSVTLTGSLLAVDAPVVASGGAKAGPTSDDKGFFSQWADKADEKGVKALWQLQPDLQKVAAEDPDLIIVSAKGADTATGQIDELKKIGAPVVVLDYSDKTWTDITTELGEATGHEKDAEKAITSYKDRVAEVKDKIEKPEQPVNFAFLAQTGKDLNFETDESAQGRILADLGWEVAVPDPSLVSDEYKGRPDVKQVTEEHLDKALVGRTALISSAGNPAPADAVKAIPTVQGTDVVKNDRIFQLKPDVFRIDYFSALSMLDQIEELFKK